MTVNMTHTTDYESRRVSREAYITWLETSERKDRERSEPLVRGVRSDGPSKASIRKKILAGL